jgi:Xaa-Pro aminopeptidase
MKPRERISFLQQELKERKLGAALLFYSRDIYYYTGTAQPSYLVVTPEEYILFVRSGFEFALNEVFIEKKSVINERRLDYIRREVVSRVKFKKIATELDVMPAERYFQFRNLFSEFEFINISPIVLEQRKRKDASEISKIREACDVIHKGHEAVLTNLREGITELELSAAVENAHRLAGHEGTIFMRRPDFFMSRGPLASGPNLARFSGVVYSVTGIGLSPAVPAGPSSRSISQGDLVVVDIPTIVKGYHSDQTRTYALGKAEVLIGEMFDRLKEIEDYLITHMGPGVKCSEIFQMAADKAEELKVADAFLNFGAGKKSQMIGHGIGLECTEPPIISRNDHSNLSEDFVICLEMHLFKKETAVIKLEDMILIGKQKNELLTKSPRTLFEVQ